jgi:hypothetical protein
MDDLPDGVTVLLINKFNKECILKKKEHVKTNQGRIPLASLMKEWNMRDVVWAETEASVGCDKNGWSDIAFSFMDEVLLKAEITGLNQLKASQDFLKNKKFTPKTSNAHTANTTQYIIQDDTKPELHPNVERKNVLSSVVKSSKDATPVILSVPVSKSVTTTGIKPIVSVNSPTIKPIPVTTPTTTSSPTTVTQSSGTRTIQIKPITKTESPTTKNILGDTPMVSPRTSGNQTHTFVPISPRKPTPTTTIVQEEDIYAKLEKLANLKDRGIITQQEFDQQKKQLLGL